MRSTHLIISAFLSLKIIVDTHTDVGNAKHQNSHKINTQPWFPMRMFKSDSGHSSEQSTAHFSSRPTVSQLKGVSDTISNWFENHRTQRTQIFTVTTAPFRSKLESNGLQIDHYRKFSERIFSTPAIFKATSMFFGSLGCSDDKNWFELSSIFFRICRFRSSILFSLQVFIPREAKFDSKWSKFDISDTLGYRLVCHFFVLTTFWRHLWSITGQMHGNMESIC